jgi:hypothetical protein
MVMLERLVQPPKAYSPMLITLSDIFTLVRFVQLPKAINQMLVTLSGMVKEVSVFPCGYFTKVVLFLLYKTPLSEEYVLLPDTTFIAMRLEQEEKT